jgi:hypothetical protein
MPNTPRFDDALPVFAGLVKRHLGEDALETHAFLRDASGRLTLILRSDIDEAARELLAKEVTAELGPYVDGPDFVAATPEQLFDESLADPTKDIREQIDHSQFSGTVLLIDRRIIGQDWTRPRFDPIPDAPPVITFYSCKGGVGRSTALAVACAAFAERGLNTLAIDLDIEAPGLGSMLLGEENMPAFGALDYLVENGLSGIDDDFLRQCVGTSALTHGQGLVEVVPAVGAMSRQHPQNVLAKLGRAFLEDPDGKGGGVSFLEQTRALIRDVVQLRSYDVVLVDARAGLSEASAAAVIGLGGDLLCFGVDSPQTFDAYRFLFAHLRRFVNGSDFENDWRYRIRMIHAKSEREEEAHKQFRDRSHQVFSELLYDQEAEPAAEHFNFDFDDENGPHYAWPIPYDAEFAEFDPIGKPNQLHEDFFDRSFGPFIERVASLVGERPDRDGR